MTRKKRQPDIDFFELVNHVQNYNLNPSTREIYLHSHYNAGHPDEEGGIEYRMSTQFVKNLHLLEYLGTGPILVHLQSPGGDWSHGMAIYDAIASSSCPVAILAHGEISSMSSIVFQAAHKRVMMPSCELMIHRGFLTLEGVANTVQSNALWHDKIDRKMLEIYANRCINSGYFKSMKQDKIIAFLDRKIRRLGDWNLNAEEAVHYGLCDGVFGNNGFEDISMIRNL